MGYDLFTGTVPASGDATNVRDALYRTARLAVPLEVVLSHDSRNTVSQDYATATGYYGGSAPNQSQVDAVCLNVLGRFYHAIQVSVAQTSVVAAQAEGSIDGINWVSVGPAISGAGIFSFTGLYKFIRVHISTLTLTGGPTYTAPYGARVVYIGTAQL